MKTDLIGGNTANIYHQIGNSSKDAIYNRRYDDIPSVKGKGGE